MSALTEKVAREHEQLTGPWCLCGEHLPYDATYAKHVAEVTEAATRAAETLRELHRIQAERDQAREECGYEKRMRAFGSEELERFIDLKTRAETDRDRLAATVERVRELVTDLSDAPEHPIEAHHRATLLAAIEGTDS